jgi:hypothetical protein
VEGGEGERGELDLESVIGFRCSTPLDRILDDVIQAWREAARAS